MSGYACQLCGQGARVLDYGESRARGREAIRGIRCDRCGEYYITPQAELELQYYSGDPGDKAMLSGVTRERSEQDSLITICSSSYKPSGEEPVGFRIDEVLGALVPRSIPERIDRGLLNLARKSRHPGDPVFVSAEHDWPLLFAEHPETLRFMLNHMVQSGFLDQVTGFDQGGGSYRLTVRGWERIEQLRQVRAESRQAFVAMWFDPGLNEAWEKGLKPAIEDAGYSPVRVDLAQFNEKIDDYIVAQIRRSRFLVVEVTGHRQAVYFEAGFAMGLGLPVIFTCRKDHLQKCNFDTRQYNHIVWESPEDLREKLKNRIDATIV